MEPTFATRWFYAQDGGRVEFGQDVCAICGLPMAEAASLKKVLRATFTDYDVLRVRNGKDVCLACEWYMSNQDLRRSGWWLTEKQALSVKKQDWLALLRAHIADPPGGYYLIKLPGLVGKHLALLAPMSEAGGDSLRVQFDVTTLMLDARWLELVDASHRLREVHSWKEIKRDHYVAAFTRRWDNLAEFVRLREVVKPWVGTAHLGLAKYVWSPGLSLVEILGLSLVEIKGGDDGGSEAEADN